MKKAIGLVLVIAAGVLLGNVVTTKVAGLLTSK